MLKFNTTVIDNHLTLKPQSNVVPLLDQLGEIFDSMVNEMTTGMAENDLVRFVIVIARIGHSPWGFSGPILQCFLRLFGEIGRQLI